MPEPITQEEWTTRLNYLNTLASLLTLKVYQGLLSPDEAQRKFNQEQARLFQQITKPSVSTWTKAGKGLTVRTPQFAFTRDELTAQNVFPYFAEVVKWGSKEPDERTLAIQSQYGKYQKQQAPLESLVGNQLRPYLNAQIAQGKMTEDEARQIEKQTRETGELPGEAVEYNLGVQSLAQKWSQPDWNPLEVQKAQQWTAGLISAFNKPNEPDWSALSPQWEQARQDALSRVSGERGWIQRWIIQRMPNPYAWQPRGTGEIIEGMKEDIERLETLQKEVSIRPGSEWSTYNQLVQGLQPAIDYWKEQLPIAQGMLEPLGPENPLGMIGAGGRRGEEPPEFPSAPKFLPTFAPELKAGEMIKKSQVPIPSTQQWSRLLPSQQEQFLGYLDWLQVNPADIGAEMERRLPSGLGGGSRWRPQVQGVKR